MVATIVRKCRGHRPGNVPRSPWCRRAARGADDRRREADAGQAGHRADVSRSSTWQAPGRPRGRARADDRRREADAGQLGKVVIDLASAGLPAAVPVVPTIDGGKLTPGNSARRSSTWQAGAFPRPCPCRPWCRRAAAVPVVPTIDAGQFQGQADAGQGGHRPGKRRGLPAAVPVPTIDGGQFQGEADDSASWSSTWQRAAVPVVPTIDAGQFQGQADGGQAGHRPGKRRGCPRARAAPWCRRAAAVPVVPTIDGGKRAESGQGGHRPGKRRGLPAAVPVPTIDAGQGGHRPGNVSRSPWCRRSTPGS